MSSFADAVHDRLLVCDGAMGTILHATGKSLDRALPELNQSNPDLVGTVHDSYVGAGVDVILTNTLGASRLRLAEHGCADKVIEINSAGVRLAKNAAAGSTAPCSLAVHFPDCPCQPAVPGAGLREGRRDPRAGCRAG